MAALALASRAHGQCCSWGHGPICVLSHAQIEESVRSMVMRYGSRLWKLRVLQAEVKINIRLTPTATAIPIRLVLATESGYYLDISLYKEVRDPSTGSVSNRRRQLRAGTQPRLLKQLLAIAKLWGGFCKNLYAPAMLVCSRAPGTVQQHSQGWPGFGPLCAASSWAPWGDALLQNGAEPQGCCWCVVRQVLV